MGNKVIIINYSSPLCLQITIKGATITKVINGIDSKGVVKEFVNINGEQQYIKIYDKKKNAFNKYINDPNPEFTNYNDRYATTEVSEEEYNQLKTYKVFQDKVEKLKTLLVIEPGKKIPNDEKIKEEKSKLKTINKMKTKKDIPEGVYVYDKQSH